MRIIDSDYLVAGSGIAGLMSALHLADSGRVLIVTKKRQADSNTNYAQGGIACVIGADDSFEQHVRDTISAGAGLCNEDVVRRVVQEGPACIDELVAMGMVFSELPASSGGGYDLGREGGHSRRRVLHARDTTGRAIESVLLERAMAHGNIQILEYHMLIDLICTGWLGLAGDNRCVGAYMLDQNRGDILAVRAKSTILATGGGGKVYLYTSNPDIATGDGVAAACRAGVPIMNMEFIQFHPTCFYHPDAKSFLISETVRGEGGKLVNGKGEEFMDRYDDRGALAPRDVVARAIDDEMKRTGATCVYLDIHAKGRNFLRERFPHILETCLQYGVDIAQKPVPVVPAAHYFCGGIQTGVDGRTSLPGLYACGETACTGLHGANRLASNSLLEALVCAAALARTIAGGGRLEDPSRITIPAWECGDAIASDEKIVVEHNWNEIRTCMWDYVGIVRTDKRLERAIRRVQDIRAEIRDYYWDYLVSPDALELRNIATVAELIVRSARQRKESRGLHYTLDYPNAGPDAVDTVIVGRPGDAI